MNGFVLFFLRRWSIPGGVICRCCGGSLLLFICQRENSEGWWQGGWPACCSTVGPVRVWGLDRQHSSSRHCSGITFMQTVPQLTGNISFKIIAQLQDDVLAGELWFYQRCLRHATSKNDGMDGKCWESDREDHGRQGVHLRRVQEGEGQLPCKKWSLLFLWNHLTPNVLHWLWHQVYNEVHCLFVQTNSRPPAWHWHTTVNMNQRWSLTNDDRLLFRLFAKT